MKLLLQVAVSVAFLVNSVLPEEKDSYCEKKDISCKQDRMAGRVMRAIRVAAFGGPDVLKLVKGVAVPPPAESQVLIKVFTVGVNPVETYIRAGNYSRLPELPFTPGSDVAGVIDEVGSKVTKFKRGDRVFTMRTVSGAYAEFAVAEEETTFQLHHTLTFSQGAALGVPYFTAYRALHIRGDVKEGETVLVHGASGSVGLASCQIARAHGCTVYGTAGTDAGMELVMKNCAHKTFNHKSDPDYVNNIMEATGGQGVDLILEMLANVNLQNDLEMLAPKGRVVIIGSRGTVEINPRLTMGKESDIRGMAMMANTPEDLRKAGDYILDGMERGWVRPVVGQEFPLEDAIKAQQEVIEHSQGSQGRIILSI